MKIQDNYANNKKKFIKELKKDEMRNEHEEVTSGAILTVIDSPGKGQNAMPDENAVSLGVSTRIVQVITNPKKKTIILTCSRISEESIVRHIKYDTTSD